MKQRKDADDAEALAFRIPQWSRKLSLGTSTIREAIARGELEAIKTGDGPRSPVIVTRVAMATYLERRRYKPKPVEPRPVESQVFSPEEMRRRRGGRPRKVIAPAEAD